MRRIKALALIALLASHLATLSLARGQTYPTSMSPIATPTIHSPLPTPVGTREPTAILLVRFRAR